ncbi:hypothetical protein RD792_007688 [Penstemon davidsonii]|uniref:SAM-dependent methyltransferase TRM5/TYW2-type domain-containing protein n=1 Tax=Penstemon davidsonii TaxID=160366 RepID=A0ABR0D7V6_9LAMI|nr:hypothetical protein RD792_007688 [Penstemon davidsonii]
MDFQKRKSVALAAMNSPAPDKSPKGNIDAPIIPLLNAINSHPSYFTTSSCSGRISILSQPTPTSSAPKKKARGGTWVFVSHDVVQPSSLIPLLFPSSAEQNLVFRFEPLIIAVECAGIESAQSLVSLAISCGFRESGITSVSKRVIIAIRCSIRMEVPLGDSEKIMVSKEYVEYLVEVANEKMGANRKRTDHFHEKLIENWFSGKNDDVEAKKIGFLGSSVENGVEVLEGELGSDTEDNYNTDSGSPEVSSISLSIVEVVGEPVERLFLWGHSACTLDQNKIIIFGGFGGIGRHARRNDLLILNTESGVVEPIAGVGGPSPRLGHTSSVVGDCIYVIGGRADPLNILNDVWVFNKTKKEWKLLPCSGSLFPPRHRHTASVVGSMIYVFGGIHNDDILSSLYVLDTDTSEWTEIEIQGDRVGPRHSHSMEANGSKLYIFGGYNGEKALGDLYCFDIETGLCNKIKTNGKSPNARFSHLMFIYSNYLGILGGCPVSKHQELFLLDLQSESWNSIIVKSSRECLFVRSTVNVVGDNLTIIGGGAACYAFGTKFSEPMKINLLHLTSLCDSTSPTAIGVKHMDSQMEKKSRTKQKDHVCSTQDSEQKVNGCADQVSEFEEPRENNGCLFAVRLAKKYAKLGKDILKHFGWLDILRKVYTQEGGTHVCFPINELFCNLLEDKHSLGDNSVSLDGLQSLKPSSLETLLKDMSDSEALNILLSCGATKIVDEVINVKKTPNSPVKVMKEAVATLLKHHGLSSEFLEQLPSRWERLGDITVLPVTSFTDPVWDSIGEELWPLVAQSLGTQRLARQGRIAPNGTRDSKLEIVVGNDGWVRHRENGILYSFDATKCMFSWGNLSEKLRMANLECRDQIIVDLFAGIGYFVLPFLVRANAKMIYACEWNPHAINALRHNLDANLVADRCIVLEGDNRVTAPKGIADRVCLGLIPSSECSWGVAVRALRNEGGTLHIHGNVKDTEEGQWVNHVVESISDVAKSEGHTWEVSVKHVERVKWYAPHIRHLVVDIRCNNLSKR